MKKTLLTLALTLTTLFGAVETSTPLPPLLLEGDQGGLYSGTAWSSEMLEGKTTLLLYVDPDERSKGEVFKPAIEAFERELDFDRFQILVILNLNATWKPDALIKKMMGSKIEEYPKRTYILDTKSALVKQWRLIDDEYNVLVIDKHSKVIFEHAGEWDGEQIDKIDRLIRSQTSK